MTQTFSEIINGNKPVLVTGIPTLMIFKNGQEKWRQAGVIQVNQLIQQLTVIKAKQ